MTIKEKKRYIHKTPLRIGFDFDGVIAYNPIRIFRRPVMWFIHKRRKTENLEFPYPKNKLIQLVWKVLHETSFFPAHGFTELTQLLRKKKIKAYIISGRYNFVDDSLMRWLKKHNALDLFAGVYVNKENIQPHHFKEKMLEQLKLDYFVEDNYDIVRYLNSKFEIRNSKQNLNNKSQFSNNRYPKSDIRQPKTEIHWIYNILDRGLEYSYKHPYLMDFIQYLQLHS
jgi:hypothetical protein